MKIGPKYKIARRLKAPIFEKTQNQKYAVRAERKNSNKPTRSRTDFGMQLNEKQKARMFYCITEKQFAKYVKKAISKKDGIPASNLLSMLERRLDNIVWRANLLPTHLSARQAVAHGHFTLNGKRTYIPSCEIKEGDVVKIREASLNGKIFSKIEENKTSIPEWISWDNKKKELTIKKSSFNDFGDALFDLNQVIEYYQR